MKLDKLLRNQSESNVGTVERWLLGLGSAALIKRGLHRRSLGGALLAAGGAMLAYRSATGHCPVYQRLGIDTTAAGTARSVHVTRTITVQRPRDEVYAFWRQLGNMPLYMDHLEDVREMGEHSRWIARIAGRPIEWEACITDDIPGERLAWRSLPDGDIETEGRVIFRDAPGQRGTEVEVDMRISRPTARRAMMLAPLFRGLTRWQLGRILGQMRQILETGELATGSRRLSTSLESRARLAMYRTSRLEQGRQAGPGSTEPAPAVSTDGPEGPHGPDRRQPVPAEAAEGGAPPRPVTESPGENVRKEVLI